MLIGITDIGGSIKTVDIDDIVGMDDADDITSWTDAVAKALDLTGQKFGRLTGICRMGPDKHGKQTWKFACDCGGELVSVGSDVKSGKATSCGCYANEVRAENSRSNRDKIASARTKHGAAGKIPEYAIWKTMRQRCANPNCTDYPDYGGRGIAVCDRWSEFTAFITDMGRRPSDQHSIDRIDNDRGYEPGNCRWADDLTQASNRRPRGAA
jgi:hypothetical protein